MSISVFILYSVALPFAASASPSDATVSQLQEARRYVSDQPRNFDNEIFFQAVGGAIVRSAHFVGESGLYGDFDGDGDVDLHDYEVFKICLEASGPDGGTPDACSVFDADADVDIDLADAGEFTVAFTGSLSMVMVEAGELVPKRSSLGSYSSGVPGTPGSDPLNGTAAQAGYTQDDLWYQWSVVSRPAGSGQVVISNASLPSTAFTILSPASTGDYVFSLTVTNLITLESGSDTVTLRLLAVPVLNVASGFVPTRLHVARGSSGRDVDFTFRAFSDVGITIYDGTGDHDFLDEVAFGYFSGTNGIPTTATLRIGAVGEREFLNPNRFNLTAQIFDLVGPVPGDTDFDGLFSDNAAPLIDPTNYDEVNERALILYTSAPWTNAPTSATATTPATTYLQWEVGEVRGQGTGPSQVSHSGISGGLEMVDGQQSFVGGVDFNRDGYTDFAVLSSETYIRVSFGRTGMNTDYDVAGTYARWPGSQANTRGEVIYVFPAQLIGIAAGDINGDGNPDLVALDNATDAVRIFFGQGSETPTPFLNANASGQFRTYATALTTDLTNARVAVGDVAGDSTEDVVIGAPNFDPDGAGTDGMPGDGALIVIHGSTQVPASGTALDVVAAAPTGRTVTGVPGGTPEQRGRKVHIGDFDGIAPLDVVAGYGNQAAGGIEVFIGGGVFPDAPALVYDLVAPGDLIGSNPVRDGSIFLADVDGAPGTDILVGASGANGGNGVFSVIPNGTPPHTPINSTATFDYVGGSGQAIGASMNVFDFDGDGDLDVIIGASGSSAGFWDVRSTSITGDFTVASVNQRLKGLGNTAGDSVIWADVNADGNNDLVLTDTGPNWAYCMFGLD